MLQIMLISKMIDFVVYRKIDVQEKSVIRGKDSSKSIIFKYARYSEVNRKINFFH